MRFTIRIGLAAAALAVFLGCATIGEIPVGLSGDQVIYISPAIADGVQDNVSFTLDVTPHARSLIKRYAVTVNDSRGVVVRSIEEAVPEGGLFSPNRKAGVTPPEFVLWDGRNDDGDFVPDGEYRLLAEVRDNWDNSGVGPVQTVMVDNKPPSVRVTSPFALFTPNGDGRLELLSIYQRGSTTEDLWTGIVSDAGAAKIKQFTWTGGARDFTWDGKRDNGTEAPEGTYTYTVSATDKAGNSASFSLSDIVLERDTRPLVLSLSARSLSPNGDGRADTITLQPALSVTTNLESWAIEIRNIRGEAVRRYAGNSIPGPQVFDGASDGGVIVDDGEYRAVLTAKYRGGQESDTASPTFAVDTQAPQAVLRVSTSVFSPDGDGLNDTVEVYQFGSSDDIWIGALLDPSGAEVVRQVWDGEMSDFVWDGTGPDGTVMADATYTYRLTSTDAAENDSPLIETRVRLDTRPVPVRITSSAARFSPNADGVQDIVDLTLNVTVPDGITSWTVSLLDSGGTVLGVLASGRSVVPARVQWNGSSAPTRSGGAPLADGRYVAELSLIYQKGNVSTSRTQPIQIDTTAPVVSVTVAPQLFSPDGDGTDDSLSIMIRAEDESPIDRWRASVYDPTGVLFMEWNGTGTPRTLRWDGRSPRGELVQSAEDYSLVVSATDATWNAGSAEVTVPIDILVIRDGDRLRIQIASIYFVPFTADYLNVEPEIAARNLETIDRLAQILKKFPQHSIRVEGHAVSVLWYDAERARVEQDEVLIPLSRARAAAIRQALIDRGVQATRMTVVGYGGSQPIVPHSDLQNRWKSRRVEFILER